MLLIIDNYDSFTYNLLDYFEQLGEECIVVKNDVDPKSLKGVDVTKLVLSPGPGKPDESGYLMEYIADYHEKIPILGICLGHQALASFFGGKIIKAIKPMHGKLSEIMVSEDDFLFLDLPKKWQVVRYHSLVVDLDRADAVKVLAKTAENEIMVIKHDQLPLYGIQYHPEAFLTDHGLKILSNWLQSVRCGTQEKLVFNS